MVAAGRGMTRYLTTPIVALGTTAIKASIDYESAFASVRKTVDATEQEFLFSYYAPDGTEYWPGFSLEIASKIASGAPYFLDIRKAS